MRVLLVEDYEIKRNRITEFLQSEYPDVEISFARSRQSGLKALTSDSFDIVLLDMSMHTYDIGPEELGGRPQPFAGREILRQMDRRGIRTPVIVVTQYDSFGSGDQTVTLDELSKEMREEHPQTFTGAVYYNVGIEGWKQDLIARIKAALGEGT